MASDKGKNSQIVYNKRESERLPKPVENENMRWEEEKQSFTVAIYKILNEEIPDDYTVSPYGMQFPCSVVNIAILEQFSKYKISSSSIFSQSFHSCF